MRNNGNLGVARWYLLRIIYSKIFTDYNIPYLLAVLRKFIFTLKSFCASLLKIMHFELPPAYKMEHMKTKLTWMHT